MLRNPLPRILQTLRISWNMVPTMVNTSSSVEKCTRTALMTLWEREIHLNTAVLTFLSHECWCEGMEATPTKHGSQLGLGSIKIYVFISRLQRLSGTLGRLFTQMGIFPPTGIWQTPACQIQLHRHELPTPTTLPNRDYLEISFHFQNISKRGVAFQVATFGHQYTWENGFVWEMSGSERLTRPPLNLMAVVYLLTCWIYLLYSNQNTFIGMVTFPIKNIGEQAQASYQCGWSSW